MKKKTKKIDRSWNIFSLFNSSESWRKSKTATIVIKHKVDELLLTAMETDEILDLTYNLRHNYKQLGALDTASRESLTDYCDKFVEKERLKKAGKKKYTVTIPYIYKFNVEAKNKKEAIEEAHNKEGSIICYEDERAEVEEECV